VHVAAGFMLTDLTFICDGQGTHWQGPGVVPFKKWRLCNDVFTEIGYARTLCVVCVVCVYVVGLSG
jgi:hypothetical protein